MPTFLPFPLLALFLLLLAAPLQAEEEGEGAPLKSVEYVAITPDIVTNFGTSGRMRFLRAKVSARAAGSDAAEAVRYHMPYVRDTLLLLLSGMDANQATSPQLRDEVRQAAVKRINGFLEQEGEPGIDDLLFTEFIVQ